MNETIFKGHIAQLKVELRAAEKRLTLSKPLVDARYDYILDTEGKLERVQVKYANGVSKDSEDSVVIKLNKWSLGGANRRCLRPYTEDEVDVLLLYVPRIDKVVRIEQADFCGKSDLYLRLAPTRRGQRKGILFAEDLLW